MFFLSVFDRFCRFLLKNPIDILMLHQFIYRDLKLEAIFENNLKRKKAFYLK